MVAPDIATLLDRLEQQTSFDAKGPFTTYRTVDEHFAIWHENALRGVHHGRSWVAQNLDLRVCDGEKTYVLSRSVANQYGDHDRVTYRLVEEIPEGAREIVKAVAQHRPARIVDDLASDSDERFLALAKTYDALHGRLREAYLRSLRTE